MAKGNFITSTVRGKLGEMVGYKNTNSNDKVKQAWRSYVPHISNPKTSGQARQRMIVSNLIQNYSSLKDIISRGFEDVKYGGKSYQRFLSLNMKNAGQGPFIPKGTRSTPLPIPGMTISLGSIISVAVHGIISAPDRTNHLVTDLYLPTSLSLQDANLTWGQFSAALIAGNTDVQDGDQLTFVCVAETENLEYVYRYRSVIIDSSSTEVLGVGDNSYRTYQGIQLWASSVSVGHELTFALTLSPDEQPCAGAVIQSRQGQDGTWLRSTAIMWVDEGNTDLMQYFSAEMFQLALESYMGSGSTTSDWPTDSDPSVNQIWVKSLVSADILVENTTHFVRVAGLVSSDFTTIKYIVKTVEGVQYLTNSDGSIFTYDETQVTAAMLTGTSASRGLVDINGLAEYNISNLRSAAPAAQDAESDTKTAKKKGSKE